MHPGTHSGPIFPRTFLSGPLQIDPPLRYRDAPLGCVRGLRPSLATRPHGGVGASHIRVAHSFDATTRAPAHPFASHMRTHARLFLRKSVRFWLCDAIFAHLLICVSLYSPLVYAHIYAYMPAHIALYIPSRRNPVSQHYSAGCHSEAPTEMPLQDGLLGRPTRGAIISTLGSARRRPTRGKTRVLASGPCGAISG